MSFEANIPEHLKQLKADRWKLENQRESMLHTCDCDYCDHQNELSDDYSQEEFDEVNKKIADLDETVKRIKEHAAFHKVEIKETVKV